MAKPETCRTCSQRLEITRIPTVDGEDTDYRVRLRDFPVLACPADHERFYVYEGFGTDLIDSVYDKNKGFFTERKGILNLRDHCQRCNQSLVGIEEENKTIEIAIRVKQGHAFRLQISGPTVICTACGNVMIRNIPRRTAEISEALAQAMTANSIKPW